MSSGRGVGGGRTDRVEDEHDSEVVDDGVVESLRDASLRAHGSARGDTRAETARGTFARAG